MASSWFFLSTLNYDARSTTHQICPVYCRYVQCASAEGLFTKTFYDSFNNGHDENILKRFVGGFFLHIMAVWWDDPAAWRKKKILSFSRLKCSSTLNSQSIINNSEVRKIHTMGDTCTSGTRIMQNLFIDLMCGWPCIVIHCG